MQDDQTQAPSGASQKSARHFELPRDVREVRPASRQLPADAEATDSSPSPSPATETHGSRATIPNVRPTSRP